jgi:fructose 1,6-bisphosphate aldolase/phosphatase
MSSRFLNRRTVLAILSLAVAVTFMLSGTTYALRPTSTTEDDGRLEEVAKAFGYGFAGTPGMTLAHDKVFRIKSAIAFTEGRAVGIFGNNAAKDLDVAAAEFLQKSGEVGISKEEVVNNLKEDRGFLNAVFDDAFLDRVIETIAKTVKTEKETPFMQLIKQIASIPDKTTRIAQARKALVEDTRFIAFLFGEKGLDPYLFSVGNILSKEHRAIVAHIGIVPYVGSENIKGRPRTIYTALARIEGFADKGEEGVELYRQMMLHEFMDLAAGKHIEPSAKLVAELNKINTEIDKHYRDVIKEVATEFTEEGSVVVTTPKVTIEKYRLVTDLGKKDTFAIMGQSKVHPEVIKGSGQKISVTIAKADTGSIGGHGTSPGLMLEAVAEEWMKAAERGEVLSFFITRTGDDISVTVTHVKGKDNRRIHELIWDGFVRSGIIAKDLGYYAAGQDLLADAFSGNVRGAGPSVAEMEFPEAGAEVLIIGQADKTAPGAFNQGLWRILFSPNTTWRPLGKGQAKDIKVGMLDFDFNNSVGRHIWWGKEDYDDAYWYMGYPDRYTVDRVTLGNGEDFAAVTAQRLGKIAGKYVGKDDPMFMIRSQSAFPAVGEISSAFLVGEYIVPGWMRGSNRGPWFPVSLMDAKIGIYDGPPLLAMWSFNLNNGRLVGFYDLMAANPAIRYVQDRRAAAAVRQLEEGFHEMGLRVGPEEIEYQEGPNLMEKRLSGRWEAFKEKEEKASSAITAQTEADRINDEVAQQVALKKTQAIQEANSELAWGEDLAVFAKAFPADINHNLSDEVIKINTNENAGVRPILINHASLLKESPDGIMALENISSQLGKGNIKLVLHIVRDNIKAGEINKIVDEALANINKINRNYTNVSRDMFDAIVLGTSPEQVSQQVRQKLGVDIYEVIGPQDYVKQFNTVTMKVVLDPANKAEGKTASISMAQALKLGLEIIPTEGKISAEKLKQLDNLFSKDEEGNFHVAASNAVDEVERKAEAYKLAAAAEIRV